MLMSLLVALLAAGLQVGPADVPVALSTRCALCHSQSDAATAMRDARGRPVAPLDLWRGTLMANSARDPLWRAVLSAEVDALPSRRREIEATCLGCHAPMADRTGLDDHGTGSPAHVLDCESDLGALARDGVSCTVCHGMSPAGLGDESSDSGGFALDDAGRMFGPHERPFAMPMRHHTGFTPTHSEHVLESSLCGTCHTLETDVYDAQGQPTGTRFLEQAPYLEWRNSAFDTEREAPGPRAASCQDCHVPTHDLDGVPIVTRIARNPGGRDFPPVRPRQPYGRHLFVGGNTLVLQMLRDHGEALGAEAPPAAFEAVLAATRRQLWQHSARVAIEDVRCDGSRLVFDVRVENLTGHKLPTAHPTRRLWLSVIVRDAAGRVVFGSGLTDVQGRILGADGQPLPSERVGGPVEPHRDRLTGPDQVARWRAVMADSDGRPTHTLLQGAAWWVDDRLLPAGWSADHAEAARTGPVGVEGDADFVPGGDGVVVDLALDELGVPSAEGLGIEVALHYQPFSARWAAELFARNTPEIRAFELLYLVTDRTPEVLARARREL